MNIDNMSIEGLFSTPLAQIDLENLNDSLFDYIRELPFELIQNDNCECSVSKKIHTDPMFFDLFKEINDINQFYAKDILGLDLSSNDFELAVRTSWIIKMKPGDWVNKHFHPYSVISGALYLSENTDRNTILRFYRHTKDPDLFNLKVVNYNIHNCENYFVYPMKNQLMLFPSRVPHSVDKNITEETIYCIAFDVSVKGVLDKNTPNEITII